MFNYYNESDTLPISDHERFVAAVPSGLLDATKLLRTLARILSLPGYFGYNWNALSDCLRDFHWLGEREIVLIHADLPDIPPNDLYQYLDVLKEAVGDWKSTDPHRLVVMFPLPLKQKVERLLSP